MTATGDSDASAQGPPTRTVLLSLGSNIDPEQNMIRALDALDALLSVEGVSSIYEGEPVGAPETPRFLNAAVRILTDLDPADLKTSVLRPLEARLGRTRTSDRNAPRTIDIDVVAVEGFVCDRSDLELPDPDILRLAHLALPLAEVAPDFHHPVEQTPLSEIGARFHGHPGIWPRADLLWPRP